MLLGGDNLRAPARTPKGGIGEIVLAGMITVQRREDEACGPEVTIQFSPSNCKVDLAGGECKLKTTRDPNWCLCYNLVNVKYSR